jgi:hypothetical protein
MLAGTPGSACFPERRSHTPRRQLGGLGRAGLALVRLLAALEAFRLGYLVGSYRQGVDCTRRLVALRSPLGGEFAAIIRAKVGLMGRAVDGCPLFWRHARRRRRQHAARRSVEQDGAGAMQPSAQLGRSWRRRRGVCPAFAAPTRPAALRASTMLAPALVQDPLHPLLRFERPPVELGEDGERPRIACEANRVARIAALRRELAQAQRGEAVDRGGCSPCS